MNLRKPEELGLSRAEWSLILDVENGHLFSADEQGNRLLSAKDEIFPNVAYAIRQTEFSEQEVVDKWKVDADALMAKLGALSDDDWEVVLEVVEGFWKLSPDVRWSRIPGDPQ